MIVVSSQNKFSKEELLKSAKIARNISFIAIIIGVIFNGHSVISVIAFLSLGFVFKYANRALASSDPKTIRIAKSAKRTVYIIWGIAFIVGIALIISYIFNIQ